MKIVVLDGYTENPGDLSWEPLKALGELTVYDRTLKEDVFDRIKEADAVYTNKTALDAQTIKACENLRFIGVLATGYNVVDIEAARGRGIPVCNVPSYGTTAVAQYVFALLLELCHHVGAHSESVKRGDWTACRDFCYWNYPLTELAGKTMGIIGFGRIGRTTGRIAQAFGMEVLAYDQMRNEAYLDEHTRYEELDELLKKSDVISLHCPLFKETEKMINKDAIAKMKEGVMLINTSRGPLIDEKDLAEALISGRISGAALDVVSAEPIGRDNPLLSCHNCLITPHIAWAPRESRQRLMDVAVDNLRAFLQGKTQNAVN